MVAVIGLIFGFLGSISLLWANPKIEDKKELKTIRIITKPKNWWYCGVSFLSIGFLLQLIEKIL